MASDIHIKKMPYYYTIDDTKESPRGMYAQGGNRNHPSVPSETTGGTAATKKKRSEYADMEPTVMGCLANIIVFLCALLFCALLTLLTGCRSSKETDIFAVDSVRYELLDTAAAAKVTDIAVGGIVAAGTDEALDYIQTMNRDDRKEIVYEETTTTTCPDGSSSTTSKKYVETAAANVRAEASAQVTASTHMDLALMAHILDSMMCERKTTEETDRTTVHVQDEETESPSSFVPVLLIIGLLAVMLYLVIAIERAEKNGEGMP